MKRVNKILFGIFFIIGSYLNAGLVDAISIVVENEPITLLEIYKYSEKFKITKQEAIDILIRQKLEDAKIKEMDIKISEQELKDEIQNFLDSKRLTKEQFINFLSERGISFEEYKNDIKKQLQRDKLYASIVKSELSSIDIATIKEYYNKNIDKFSVAKSLDIVRYSSNSQNVLKELIKNPMKIGSNIAQEQLTITQENTNPRLFALLNNVPEKSFSTIIPAGNSYVVFFIDKKYQIQTKSFEEVKDLIYSNLAKEKEQNAIKNYFEKLKAESKITLLRKP